MNKYAIKKGDLYLVTAKPAPTFCPDISKAKLLDMTSAMLLIIELNEAELYSLVRLCPDDLKSLACSEA